MAMKDYLKVEEQEFSAAESRKASDFGEVCRISGFEPDDFFDFLQGEDLSEGAKLFFANTLSQENLEKLRIMVTDQRIDAVIERRKNGREEEE